MERDVKYLGFPKTWTYWTTKKGVNVFFCWNIRGYCRIYVKWFTRKNMMSTNKALLCIKLGNYVIVPLWAPIYQQAPYIG